MILGRESVNTVIDILIRLVLSDIFGLIPNFALCDGQYCQMTVPNYVCYDIAMQIVSHCSHFLDEFKANEIPTSLFRYFIAWHKAYNRQMESDQMEHDV